MIIRTKLVIVFVFFFVPTIKLISSTKKLTWYWIGIYSRIEMKYFWTSNMYCKRNQKNCNCNRLPTFFSLHLNSLLSLLFSRLLSLFSYLFSLISSRAYFFFPPSSFPSLRICLCIWLCLWICVSLSFSLLIFIFTRVSFLLSFVFRISLSVSIFCLSIPSLSPSPLLHQFFLFIFFSSRVWFPVFSLLLLLWSRDRFDVKKSSRWRYPLYFELVKVTSLS